MSAEESVVEAQARRVSEVLNIAENENRNTMKRNTRGTHRRRLSLENADGSFRERRSSLIAESVQEEIHNAPPDQQLAKLMTAMLAEQAKIKPLLAQDLVYVAPEDAKVDAANKAAAAVQAAADGIAGAGSSAGASAEADNALDPEMASWGLSAINEFCAGNVENRKLVAEGGGQSIILDIMAFFFNDVYCQWQGCYSLASLAADRVHAAAFGTDGIDAVLQCIGRTDLSELAAAGCRALSALCHFDTPPEEGGPLTELILHAKAHGVATEMQTMLASFPKDFQFQFRGQALLQKFEKFVAPAAPDAAGDAAGAASGAGTSEGDGAAAAAPAPAPAAASAVATATAAPSTAEAATAAE